jgi:hypothetical protein
VSASFTASDDHPGVREPLDRDACEIGVHADRSDRRDVGMVGIRPHRLCTQRPDPPGGVRALQRRQIDHGNGHVDRLEFRVGLDGPGREDRRTTLQPDLIDAGQPVQEAPQRGLVVHHVGKRRREGGGHSASLER